MDAGARVIHFDVMDGHFVPPITIGPLVLSGDRRPGPRRRRRRRRPPDDRGARAPDRGVRQGRRRLDHLPRGGDPARQPHPARDPRARLPGRRSRSTPAPRSRRVSELRGLADIVLCMTVNPGWGGQSFIESSPDKVERLRAAGRRGPDRGRRRHRHRRPPARSPPPAPPSSSPAPPSSAPPTAPPAYTPQIAELAGAERRALHGAPRRLRRSQPRLGDQRAGDLLPPGPLGRVDVLARSARRSHQPASARRPPIATTPSPVTA